MDVVNSIMWIAANFIVAYIATVVVIFVVLYYIFFDPKATTAGKMIFRFMVSMVGVIGLVFIGIFVDPAHGRGPFDMGPSIEWWRPAIRLAIYAYVAYTSTTLSIALIMRKWFPERVKKAADLALVKTRTDTSEIPIVRP